MELIMFAVDDGYCEGIVRGFRSSFLTHEHYEILKNCTQMETFKAVISYYFMKFI